MTQHDQNPGDPGHIPPRDDPNPPRREPTGLREMSGSRHLLRALVDDVDRANRAIAAAMAERAEAVDRLRLFTEASALSDPHDTSAKHGWTPEICAERELYMELAGVLNVSENSARNIVYESKLLANDLPVTIGALHDGSISFAHARVIIDNAASVPAEKVGEFESALIPEARRVTVPKLKKIANRLREAMYPESKEQRHVEAVDRRTVWLEPADDGMATIGALVSAELAHGMMDRLTEIAQGVPDRDPATHRRRPDDTRTLAQRRADAFADLLLTGDTCAATADATGSGRANLGHGVVPRVLVTVPVMTLLGTSRAPGNLGGYGPIDAETARDLAAHAPSFTRLLTHPVSSAILDFDRTTYVVPSDLKLAVRLRDETCRAIGCDNPAKRSDLDHTDEWHDGGATSLDNLACLCETHHNVKSHTRVTMEHRPGGDIRWTMPSGREYLTHPAIRIDELYGKAA